MKNTSLAVIAAEVVGGPSLASSTAQGATQRAPADRESGQNSNITRRPPGSTQHNNPLVSYPGGYCHNSVLGFRSRWDPRHILRIPLHGVVYGLGKNVTALERAVWDACGASQELTRRT